MNKLLKNLGFYMVVLSSTLILTSCSEQEDVIKLENDTTIVAFGDSLTYGYGVNTMDDSYPSKLQTIIGYTVINEGLNGDTARNGKSRIIHVVEEHDPDLVIVGIGGNDMLRRQDKNLENDLSEIVEYLIERHIQVVLLAEPQPTMAFLVNSLSDAAVYEKVASKYNIPLIENVYSKYLSDFKYKSDAIHLNALGYNLVAEDIADELRSLGLID
jgi:acyl-CoA thioesterase-1